MKVGIRKAWDVAVAVTFAAAVTTVIGFGIRAGYSIATEGLHPKAVQPEPKPANPLPIRKINFNPELARN